MTYIIVTSNFGPMLINGYDQSVGTSIFTTGTHEQDVVGFVSDILDKCKELNGVGVSALDVGANVGVCTLAWAKHMTGWGKLLGFEAQERNYYALAGNVAMNNLYNAKVFHSAISDKNGIMKIPTLDHTKPGHFGGLALFEGSKMAPGQHVSFAEGDLVEVPTFKLDTISGRVDLIKIDVEGMEPQVLDGAQQLIEREKPIIVAEYLHCGPPAIKDRLPGYCHFLAGINVYSIHEEQKEMVEFVKSSITFSKLPK
jgi:FkbM family methyltransferase